MKIQLTALITCKNEEHNIRDCIESVSGIADEVLVADSGSTDRTLEIVRQLGGCRIVQRDEYVSAGNFKNWAIPHASNSWILVVDSDERVTPELAAEVRRTLDQGPEHDGYRIRFQNFFLGRKIKHCGWNTTTGIRLFRREVCDYRELRVHSDVDVHTGRIGKLEGRFHHYAYQSLSKYMERVNRYSTWSAQQMFEAGRRVSPLGVLCRPLGRFLQFYIYRGGLFDGTAGLIICMATSFYTFLKYAKLWELQQGLIDSQPAAENQSSEPSPAAADQPSPEHTQQAA